MRRLGVALIAGVIVASFAVSGYALYSRFTQGDRARAALREQDLKICRSENVLRKVLHDEHTKDRTQAIAKRDRLQKFIDSGRKIPGITKDELLLSLSDAKQEVRDEKAIIDVTQPKSCP